MESKIGQIAAEILDHQYGSDSSEKEFKWLSTRCRDLASLLNEHKPGHFLSKGFISVADNLASHNELMDDHAMRERIFKQQHKAVIFWLVKEGYLKIFPF